MSISFKVNSVLSDSLKFSIVPTMFKSVVFPAPEGPIIEINSPFLTSSEILSNIF